MNNRMKFAHGMTGLLSASALVVGLASNAYALHIASDVGTGISTYHSTDGGAGVFAPGSAINITNSRHNLSTTNTLGSNHTLGSSGTGPGGTSVLDAAGNIVGTNQICVFCHTPHGFNAVQSGPLWNKAVNASTTYAVYNTGTNVSSTYPGDKPSIGSVSLACLSCHDGTQAMDNMINGPGSALMAAGYDGSLSSASASQFIVGGANPGESQAYTWGDTAGGFAQMSQGGAGMTGSIIDGDTPAREGILIGTDLSNDHPISMQYCGGGISSSQASTPGTAFIAAGTCRERLFNLPTTTTEDGVARFWVDTNVILDSDAVAAGAASIGGVGALPITRDPKTVELYVTDGIQLASRVDALTGTSVSGVGVTECGSGNNGDACGRGFVSSLSTSTFVPVAGAGIFTKQDIRLFTNNVGVTGPSVECASCHDPHTPNNGTFLRVSNQGSGLCLSCHVK
ncbi:MAG: cytochrome c3 family protein [Gallionellaceae bacterium]